MRIENCTTAKEFRKVLKQMSPEIGMIGGRHFIVDESQYTLSDLVTKLAILCPTASKESSKTVREIRSLDKKGNMLLEEQNVILRVITFVKSYFFGASETRAKVLTKLEKAPQHERKLYNLHRALKQQQREKDGKFQLAADVRPLKVSRKIIRGGGSKHCGVAACKGGRREMEDYIAAFPIQKHNAYVAAVFDGHVGFKTAEYLKKNVEKVLTEQLSNHGLTDEGIYRALKETFVELDKNVPDDSGSTAILTLLVGENIWTACVGDSRAVLSTKERTTQLSEDARVDLKRYARKILGLGGEILNRRILGQLAVARTIGDRLYQNDDGVALVSAKPKITCVPKGGIVVLSSDGLTDVASTNQIGAAVQSLKDESPEEIARRLVNSAIKSGSEDNVAVAVLIT